jgi:hypothetical protein
MPVTQQQSSRRLFFVIPFLEVNPMFWLILIGSILGGFIALVLLIMIVGRFLPERYAARVEMTIPRPPEEVWAAMNDYHKHPLTGAMMKRIEDLPPQNQLPAWVEDMGSSKVTVTTAVAEPPRHLVRELVDSVVPMTARAEIHLERVEDGCKVTATQETHIRNGTWHVPIFRVILTVTKGTQSSLATYWKKIAKDLGEPGQVP